MSTRDGINMNRTTIFLKPEQQTKLAKVAEAKGLKPAQLIRLYINEGLKRDKT